MEQFLALVAHLTEGGRGILPTSQTKNESYLKKTLFQFENLLAIFQLHISCHHGFIEVCMKTDNNSLCNLKFAFFPMIDDNAIFIQLQNTHYRPVKFP